MTVTNLCLPAKTTSESYKTCGYIITKDETGTYDEVFWTA